MKDLIEYKLVKEGGSIIVDLCYRGYRLGWVHFITPPSTAGRYMVAGVGLGVAPYFSITKDDMKRLAGDYMRRKNYKLTD